MRISKKNLNKLVGDYLKEASRSSSDEQEYKNPKELDTSKVNKTQDASLIKKGVVKQGLGVDTAYLKFVQSDKVYALNKDGVLYSRMKGKGEDYEPMDDLKGIQAITKSIIDNFSFSGWVSKVKDKMSRTGRRTRLGKAKRTDCC